MPLYRRIPHQYQCLQLNDANWPQIVSGMGVGSLANGEPEGVFIDTDGNVHALTEQRQAGWTRALLIPFDYVFGVGGTPNSPTIRANEGDMLVRTIDAKIRPMNMTRFNQLFELV